MNNLLLLAIGFVLLLSGCALFESPEERAIRQAESQAEAQLRIALNQYEIQSNCMRRCSLAVEVAYEDRSACITDCVKTCSNSNCIQNFNYHSTDDVAVLNRGAVTNRVASTAPCTSPANLIPFGCKNVKYSDSDQKIPYCCTD